VRQLFSNGGILGAKRSWHKQDHTRHIGSTAYTPLLTQLGLVSWKDAARLPRNHFNAAGQMRANSFCVVAPARLFAGQNIALRIESAMAIGAPIGLGYGASSKFLTERTG